MKKNLSVEKTDPRWFVEKENEEPSPNSIKSVEPRVLDSGSSGELENTRSKRKLSAIELTMMVLIFIAILVLIALKL